MTCEEVKISLHDYVDESLDEITKREIERHIRNCNVCIREYKKLTGFFDKLKELPIIIDPPSDIISSVLSNLMDQSDASHPGDPKEKLKKNRKVIKERERQEKELRKRSAVLRKIKATRKAFSKNPYRVKSNLNLKRTILIMLPLAVMGLGYFIYDLHKYNYPWKVIALEGIQKINGSDSKNDLWSQGDTLTTDENSKVMVHVPNVGSMEAGKESRLILLRGKEGSNQVTLEKGFVKITNSNNMPEFSFGVGNSIIYDRGGEFTIEVDNNGNGMLSVKYAFAEIVFNGDHYYVDENYNCEIRFGRPPGIPIHAEASDSLKAAVEMFNNLNGGESAVEKIIAGYKEKDILTLLALIPRVPQLQRQILFQEISNFFPPPESITRAGIIRLDPEMLYKWWEDIEWQL